jgi:hypothetical protein
VPVAAPILVVPVAVGVRAVDTVAWAAARVEPTVPIAVAGWLVIALVLVGVLSRAAPDDMPDSNPQLSQ